MCRATLLLKRAFFFASYFIVLLAVPASSQDTSAAVAALIMLEAFDVPLVSIESVTTKPDAECAEANRVMACEGSYQTRDATICRGVTVGFGAGVIYRLINSGLRIEVHVNIRCTRHRTTMTFVPGARTTVVEYVRSSGEVLYRNSIKS